MVFLMDAEGSWSAAEASSISNRRACESDEAREERQANDSVARVVPSRFPYMN